MINGLQIISTTNECIELQITWEGLVTRRLVTDKQAATRSSLTRSYFPPCGSPHVAAVDIVEVVDVATGGIAIVVDVAAV